MKERERVATQIIDILFKYHNQVLFAEEVPEILSIPELAILSDDQSLPLRDVHTTCEHCNDHELGIEDMLNCNFKRVI